MDLQEVFTRSPLLQTLAPAERERTMAGARLREFDRGQNVWELGDRIDAFLLVAQGRVRLVKPHGGGRETIVRRLEPYAPLCCGAVWTDDPRCCSAVAAEKGTLIFSAPVQTVREIVEKNPAVSRIFFESFHDCALKLAERIEELGAGKVERRIATLLLRLANRGAEGDCADCGNSIANPPSRREIASLCGTTVETAIRVMRRLECDGVLQKQNGGLYIADGAKLEKMARG